MDARQTLGQLAARSPAEAVAYLAQLYSHFNAMHPGSRPALPVVRLVLTSGAVLEGTVTQWLPPAGTREGAVSLLHGGRSTDLELSFVSAHHLAGVTLCFTPQNVSLMNSATLGTSGVQAAPVGKLELKRLAEKLREGWAPLGWYPQWEDNWEGLPLADDAARAAWHQLLTDLEAVVQSILADELGRQALAAVTRVRLQVAPTAQVSRDGQVLRVAVGQISTGAPLQVLSRTDLRREVEKVL